MEQSGNPDSPKREAITSILSVVVILLGIYATAVLIGFDELEAKVGAAGVWGPLVLMAAKATALVFAPIGGSPLYPVAGALFGPVYGFIYIFIGDAIGSALCFWISRRFGRSAVGYFVKGEGMKLVNQILTQLETTRGFLEARIFFIAFPEGVSYAAGLSKIGFVKFFLLHMGVYVIPTAAYVSLGGTLTDLGPWGFFAAIGLFSVLALGGIIVFYRRVKARAVVEINPDAV